MVTCRCLLTQQLTGRRAGEQLGQQIKDLISRPNRIRTTVWNKFGCSFHIILSRLVHVLVQIFHTVESTVAILSCLLVWISGKCLSFDRDDYLNACIAGNHQALCLNTILMSNHEPLS